MSIDGDTYMILSSALTFGVPILLGLRELALLRRETGRRGDDPGSTEPTPQPSPDADQLPPLPASLVDAVRRPQAPQVRALETV